MKNFFRQNGILLLVIALLLSILIGISSALLGGNSDPLSNVVNTVTSPIRGGISAVLNWAEGVYEYVVHYDELHQELDELRLQVSELEEQVLIRMSNSFVPFNTGNPLTRLIEVHGLQGRDIHCDDDRLMMSLAKAGYGVAILPGYCIPTYAEQIGLRCIPIEESQKLVYGAAVHRGREKKSLEAFLRLAAAELRAGPRTMRKPVEAEDMDQ